MNKGDILHCPRCRKTYMIAQPNVCCAVLHADGDCCHYGQREVKVTITVERADEQFIRATAHRSFAA